MKNFEGENILVTGGMGFVGSWLCNSLMSQGANVVTIIRDRKPQYEPALKGCTLVNGDTADYRLVERVFNQYEIGACFHLAAHSVVATANRSPLSTFESNIRGTWNVLEAARVSEKLKMLIVASSDKVYGTQQIPYKEDQKLLGNHPYDASKVCADTLSFTYHNTYGLPVAILRCGNIYGGRDMNFNRLIPRVMGFIVKNKNPIIRTGKPIRDFIYVKDIIDCYLSVAENFAKAGVKGNAFNAGGAVPISIEGLVDKIIEISGKKLGIEYSGDDSLHGEIKEQYVSTEKIRRVVGWSAKTKLADGLKETMKWYDDYINRGVFS